MMFSNFSYFVRLSLCLLFSTGVHGGLAFYDWTAQPSESQLANAPVTVSLRSGAVVASPAYNEVALPAPAPVSTNKTPRSVEDKQTIVTPPPLASVPEVETPKQVSKKPPVVTIVERAEAEPKITVASTELVCMQPQDAVLNGSSEISESPQSAAVGSTAVAVTNKLPSVAVLPPLAHMEMTTVAITRAQPISSTR